MIATPAPGCEPDMTPCYWGSVNQWECDENNHLNVRFYARKVNEAVQIFLSQISDTIPNNLQFSVVRQHIRFLAESRSATPLRVDCGVLSRSGAALDVLSLMHDNVSGKTLAAFTSQLRVDETSVDGIDDKLVNAPESARPRGLDPSAIPDPPIDPAHAREAGYRIVGRSLVTADLCNADGHLAPDAYVGLISDGMPNLWAFLNPPGEQSGHAGGELGGAALEQHLVVHRPLQRGCVFSQLSGVRSIGNKTQHMAHVLYDETHGRIAAAMEAVGVAMDLSTRRAVPISAEQRRHLEALLLK